MCTGTANLKGRSIRSSETLRAQLMMVDESFAALDEGVRNVFCQLLRQVLEESHSGNPPVLSIMLSSLAGMSKANRMRCLGNLGVKMPKVTPHQGQSSPSSSPACAKESKMMMCTPVRNRGATVGVLPPVHENPTTTSSNSPLVPTLGLAETPLKVPIRPPGPLTGSISRLRGLAASSPPPPGLAENPKTLAARGAAAVAAGPIAPNNVAQTLAQLASLSPENQAAIGRAGGVAALLRIIKESSTEDQAKAAAGLLHLVQGSPTNQSALVNGGGIELLVALCSEQSATTETCGHVAKVLATLAKIDAAYTDRIVSAGGIALLVRMMDQGSSSSGCVLAVFALRSLALSSHRTKTLIVKAGAVAPLIRLLKEGPLESRGYAAGALAALADGSTDNQAAIVAACGLAPLVSLLEAGCPDASRRAASALTHVALHSSEHQVLIARAGGVPPLVRLARSDGLCNVEAAQALAALARSCAENQAAILAAGGVKILIDLFSRGGGAARRHAGTALDALAESAEGRAAILASGGSGDPSAAGSSQQQQQTPSPEKTPPPPIVARKLDSLEGFGQFAKEGAGGSAKAC